MPAEFREKPIITDEDARRFLEREQQVNEKRKKLVEQKRQEWEQFNKPKQYRVLHLYQTLHREKDFNVRHHIQYLHKVGIPVEHYHHSETFKDFICLRFENDEVDWFHKNDLEEI